MFECNSLNAEPVRAHGQHGSHRALLSSRHIQQGAPVMGDGCRYGRKRQYSCILKRTEETLRMLGFFCYDIQYCEVPKKMMFPKVGAWCIHISKSYWSIFHLCALPAFGNALLLHSFCSWPQWHTVRSRNRCCGISPQRFIPKRFSRQKGNNLQQHLTAAAVTPTKNHPKKSAPLQDPFKGTRIWKYSWKPVNHQGTLEWRPCWPFASLHLGAIPYLLQPRNHAARPVRRWEVGEWLAFRGLLDTLFPAQKDPILQWFCTVFVWRKN